MGGRIGECAEALERVHEQSIAHSYEPLSKSAQSIYSSRPHSSTEHYMRTTQTSVALLATSLILLVIAPAGGAPALSLQSNAAYKLNANVSTVESCTASDPVVTGLICGSSSPPTFQAFVTILDDGTCSPPPDPLCQFTPKNVNITVGGTVTWHNSGGLLHTVTSDQAGAFSFSLPSSNTMPNTFASAGTFTYHCSIHPWMTGTVNVSQPTAPPPKVRSFILNGTLGWTVLDLDQNDAVLRVNHGINVFNSTSLPAVRVFNETGAFEQTVDLSSRVESPPALGVLASFPFSLGSSGFSSFSSPYLYSYGFQPPAVHTIWWVNGPLDRGSPVQILTIYAGVRGSDSVDLGPVLGTRDAWIVGADFTEARNQTEPLSQSDIYLCFPFGRFITFGAPQPQCFVSGSYNAVSLRFAYGKQSDLLFTSSDSIDSYVQTTAVYPAGSTVYGGFGGPGIPVSTTTTVVRTMRTSVSLSLKLMSTNLDLTKRMTPPPQSKDTSDPPPGSNAPNNNAQASLPLWIYGTAGVIALAGVSTGVWATLRARRKTQPAGPLAPPTPA